jgi:hypothetical protein
VPTPRCTPDVHLLVFSTTSTSMTLPISYTLLDGTVEVTATLRISSMSIAIRTRELPSRPDLFSHTVVHIIEDSSTSSKAAARTTSASQVVGAGAHVSRLPTTINLPKTTVSNTATRMRRDQVARTEKIVPGSENVARTQLNGLIAGPSEDITTTNRTLLSYPQRVDNNRHSWILRTREGRSRAANHVFKALLWFHSHPASLVFSYQQEPLV